MPAGLFPEAQARLTDALVRTGAFDKAAFREVYLLTRSKLRWVCYRVCGNMEAAEDVLHEVYLTVWRRAHSFQPSKGTAMGWLRRIAHNRAIDWLRAQAHHRSDPIAAADAVADDRPLVSETMIAAEASERVRRCLQRLPEDQREAIRAAFFEGHTYAELARLRGVPVGTMKSWIRRGLIALREDLGE